MKKLFLLFALLFSIGSGIYAQQTFWNQYSVSVGNSDYFYTYYLTFKVNPDGQSVSIIQSSLKNLTYSQLGSNEGLDIVLPETATDGDVAYTVTGIATPYPSEDRTPQEGVFAYSMALRSVVVPNTYTEIGGGAFYCCANLKKIVLGNAVESIGDDAFQYCSNLSDISLPNSLKKVGSHFLCGVTGLKKLVLPENLTEIGDFFLHGCANLREVYILGTKEKKLGKYPFQSHSASENVPVNNCTFYVENQSVYEQFYKNTEGWKLADADYTGVEYTGSYYVSRPIGGTTDYDHYRNIDGKNHYEFPIPGSEVMKHVYKWTTACFPEDVDAKANFGDDCLVAELTETRWEMRDARGVDYYSLHFSSLKSDDNGRVIMKAGVPYMLRVDQKNAGSAFIIEGDENMSPVDIQISNQADDHSALNTTIRMLGVTDKESHQLLPGEYLFYNPKDENGDYDNKMMFIGVGRAKRTVSPYHCYWQIVKDGTVTTQSKIAMVFDDMVSDWTEQGNITNAIDDIETQQNDGEVSIYNLQGVRISASDVNSLPKGLYIVNGKKMLVN